MGSCVGHGEHASVVKLLTPGQHLARIVGITGAGVTVRPLGAPDHAFITCVIGTAVEPGDIGRRALLAVTPEAPELAVLTHVLRDFSPPLEVTVEDDRLQLEAHTTVELRCGEASITLHRDGRIHVRGAEIISAADGVRKSGILPPLGLRSN
ncbi:MAG: hypothetical protein AAGA56_19500, partial [Myxococcota bacterium]